MDAVEQLLAPTTSADTGAEATPAESSTAPEASSQPSEQPGAGETPQGLQPEKSSQGKPAPGGEPQQQKVPWDKDPRWTAWRKEEKTWQATKPLVDGLRQRGLNTVEDADFLIEQVETLKASAGRADNIESAMFSNPENVAAEWNKTYPESYAKVATAIHSAMLPGTLQRLAQDAQAEGHADVAQFLMQAAQGQQKRFQQQTQNGNGQQRVDPERQKFQQERQQFEQQRQEAAMGKAQDSVSQMLDSKINPLVAGVAFRDDEQRELFMELVERDLENAAQGSPIFQQRLDSLRQNIHSPDAVQKLVKAHEAFWAAGGLGDSIVAKRLSQIGAQAQAAADVANGKLLNGRKEPAGGSPGAPAVTAATERSAREADLASRHRKGQISTIERMKQTLLSPL